MRVIDIDGDLDKLLYAKGEHTAEEFANGTVEGTPFTVNDKDTAAFQITEKEPIPCMRSTKKETEP